MDQTQFPPSPSRAGNLTPSARRLGAAPARR